MPTDDWATRHPELVHWLHQAEDELVGYAPWGVAIFVSSRLLEDWCRHGQSLDSSHWLPEALPWLGQPAAPIVARIIKQPLAAPTPTPPVRHGPWRPPLLA